MRRADLVPQNYRRTDDAQVGYFLSEGVTKPPATRLAMSTVVCSLVCITFLPYGELTVQHLPNLTQFGSMK